jgi:hypothetical protein
MTKIKEDMKEIGKVELHPKFDFLANDYGNSAFISFNSSCKLTTFFV